MVINSGRCHGPGCTQAAVIDGGFCGEVCQARWHGQFGETAAGLPTCDCLPPDRTVGRHTCVPVRVSIRGHIVEETATSLAAAADRVSEIIAESTTWTVDAANIEPLPDRLPNVLENLLRAYEHIEQVAPPEPVKLTRRQWEALRAANPPPMPAYGVGGALGDLSGVPIELVEDERDSTLCRAPVEAVGVFEAFEVPPTFGPLPPAVDGDSTERVCEPKRGFRRWLDRLARRYP